MQCKAWQGQALAFIAVAVHYIGMSTLELEERQVMTLQTRVNTAEDTLIRDAMREDRRGSTVWIRDVLLAVARLDWVERQALIYPRTEETT